MGKFLDKEGVKKLWQKIKDYTSSSVEDIIDDKLGQPDGIPSLGSDGKIESTQLPDFKTINNESIIGTGNIDIVTKGDLGTQVSNLGYVKKTDIASQTDAGVIQLGYENSGKNYAVEVDGSGKAFVNVPWEGGNSADAQVNVSPKNPTLQYGQQTEIVTINNTSVKVTMPDKVLSHLYAGSGTAANATTANGNTKLTIANDVDVAESVVIKGDGTLVNVASDNLGVVTITTTATADEAISMEELDEILNEE